jgi:hypothetical protein
MQLSHNSFSALSQSLLSVRLLQNFNSIGNKTFRIFMKENHCYSPPEVHV